MTCYGTNSSQRGFTLLEVMLALAILAVSLLVLVDVQNNSALMSKQAEKMLVGTMLAKDKLIEAQLELENKGFTTTDTEESGDFSEAYSSEYPEYTWILKVSQMDAGGAVTGLGSMLDAARQTKEEQAKESGAAEQVGGLDDQLEQGAGMLGMDPEFLSEELGRFIREVRVRVTWTDGASEDYVELVAHVINPSGKVNDVEAQQEDNAAAAANAGGGQ